MRSRNPYLPKLSAVCVAAGIAALTGTPVSATQVYGTLSNFDVYNTDPN